METTVTRGNPHALKFIKTIKSKENKTMETVYYKSYKELVSEYFGIDYKIGENAPKLSKQLSKKGIEYTQEELQAFSELLLAVFSDCKELVYTFKLSDILPSYREDVLREEGFVWSDNQDRYINLDDDDFTFCENIEDFEELYYVSTCEHCDCPFSVNGDYAEVQGVYFCSDDCASEECVWSEYYSEYILIDNSFCCEDCGDNFYHDDMEEGSDGCLYCSDCIHEHLED